MDYALLIVTFALGVAGLFLDPSNGHSDRSGIRLGFGGLLVLCLLILSAVLGIVNAYTTNAKNDTERDLVFLLGLSQRTKPEAEIRLFVKRGWDFNRDFEHRERDFIAASALREQRGDQDRLDPFSFLDSSMMHDLFPDFARAQTGVVGGLRFELGRGSMLRQSSWLTNAFVEASGVVTAVTSLADFQNPAAGVGSSSRGPTRVWAAPRPYYRWKIQADTAETGAWLLSAGRSAGSFVELFLIHDKSQRPIDLRRLRHEWLDTFADGELLIPVDSSGEVCMKMDLRNRGVSESVAGEPSLLWISDGRPALVRRSDQ